MAGGGGKGKGPSRSFFPEKLQTANLIYFIFIGEIDSTSKRKKVNQNEIYSANMHGKGIVE